MFFKLLLRMLVFLTCLALWAAPVTLVFVYVRPAVGAGAIVLYALVSIAFVFAYVETKWM